MIADPHALVALPSFALGSVDDGGLHALGDQRDPFGREGLAKAHHPVALVGLDGVLAGQAVGTQREARQGDGG